MFFHKKLCEKSPSKNDSNFFHEFNFYQEKSYNAVVLISLFFFYINSSHLAWRWWTPWGSWCSPALAPGACRCPAGSWRSCPLGPGAFRPHTPAGTHLGTGPEAATRTLKGLSHEIVSKMLTKMTDFGLNEGRGWFLNFSEAPLIFSWIKHLLSDKC